MKNNSSALSANTFSQVPDNNNNNNINNNEQQQKIQDLGSIPFSANPIVQTPNGTAAVAAIEQPKTTIVKQTYLVFNDSGNSVLTATLRVCNPSSKSDIFYKLYSDYYRMCFLVKSWKGHVRRNSYVEVVISTNVMSAKDRTAEMLKSGGENYPHCITLGQLCQTKFTLELTEYVSKFRNFNTGSAVNGNGPSNSANNSSFNRPSQTMANASSSVKNKFELQCVTREILLKMQNETKINIEDVVSTNRDGANKLAQNGNLSGKTASASCDANEVLAEGELREDSELVTNESGSNKDDSGLHTNDLLDTNETSNEQDNSSDSSLNEKQPQVESPRLGTSTNKSKSNQPKEKQTNGALNSADCAANQKCQQKDRVLSNNNDGKLFGVGRIDSLLVMIWALLIGMVKGVLSFFTVQLQKIRQKMHIHSTKNCNSSKVAKNGTAASSVATSGSNSATIISGSHSKRNYNNMHNSLT